MRKRISNPVKGMIVILAVVLTYCAFERVCLGNKEYFNVSQESAISQESTDHSLE